MGHKVTPFVPELLSASQAQPDLCLVRCCRKNIIVASKLKQMRKTSVTSVKIAEKQRNLHCCWHTAFDGGVILTAGHLLTLGGFRIKNYSSRIIFTYKDDFVVLWYVKIGLTNALPRFMTKCLGNGGTILFLRVWHVTKVGQWRMPLIINSHVANQYILPREGFGY